MVGRGEVTQQVWSDIAPLLPTGGQHGGQWRDHRTVNRPTDLVQACQDDDRDAPGGRVGFDPTGRLLAVDVGQSQVHQNEVGLLRRRHGPHRKGGPPTRPACPAPPADRRWSG